MQTLLVEPKQRKLTIFFIRCSRFLPELFMVVLNHQFRLHALFMGSTLGSYYRELAQPKTYYSNN
jgi:cell division protein FtsB